MPATNFHGEAAREPYQLWPTYSAFAESASNGCHTCILFHDAVQEPFRQRLETEPVYLERVPSSEGGRPQLALTVDLHSLPDVERQKWDQSLRERSDGRSCPFRFVPINEIVFVLDPADIPQAARSSQGEFSIVSRC